MTAEPTSPPDRSRRQVLCGIAVALIAPGALAAACSSDSGTGSSTPASSGGSGGAGGGVLAKVSDVPVGGGVLVNGADGKQLLLVQPTAGTVHAFDPTCPHQGTTVGTPQGGTITCPNHGSQFDAATGAVKRGPAATGLKEVAVTVTGGNVVTA